MVEAHRQAPGEFDAEFSASLMRSAWESIWRKIRRAAEQFGINVVSVSGGVAVNGLFREYLVERGKERGLKLCFPEPRLAMDNAEMMAFLLWLKLNAGKAAGPFDVESRLI
jgi:N6-L-threonylcarbamoyladenine synthase